MTKDTRTARYLTGGFVQLSRSVMRHELSPSILCREYTEFEAFVDMILFTNYTETPCGDLDIKRGQFLKSNAQLADRWFWDTAKVIVFKRKLERMGEIECQKLKSGSDLITLLKYDTYAGPDWRTGRTRKLEISEDDFSA